MPAKLKGWIYHVLLVLTFTVAISNAYIVRGSNAQVESTALCDQKDEFYEGWCSKHICQLHSMITCPSAQECDYMQYKSAADPAWGLMPPFQVKVWWQCNCVCCGSCRQPGALPPGLANLLGLFGKKKK